MSHHLCKSTFSDEMEVILKENFQPKFEASWHYRYRIEFYFLLLDAQRAASLIGRCKFLLSVFTKTSNTQGRYIVLIRIWS